MSTGILQLGSLFLLCLSLFSPPAFSEGSNGITIQPESPQPVVELPKPGEVDPGKAPVPAHTDRKQSQAQASAMAAMAAGMQQMSCMMMMKEAMKQEGSDKSLMMALAMQQCAQAAQTLANAAENKKNSDKVDADPGKPASMKLGEFKAPQAQKDQSNIDNSSGTSSASEGVAVAPDPEVSSPPAIPSFVTPAPAIAQETPAPSIAPNIEMGGIPNTIERAKIGYDETGKSSSGPLLERQLGTGSSVATSKPGAEGTAKYADNVTGPGGTSKNRGLASSEANVASGGESEKSGDGSSPLDAMLATLLGGPPKAEEGPESNGQELANLSAGKENGKSGPNIFEYASYRYRKVTYDEGKIKVRSPKQGPSKLTTAMAVPSASNTK